jgi:long-chain fatty acid transport protein
VRPIGDDHGERRAGDRAAAVGEVAVKQVVCVVVALFAAGTMRAQSSAEVNAGVSYNFGSPGARSLATGGAFLGIADDATAAYTNPAGLLSISRPQVALEGRGWSFTNIYSDRGHVFGNPSHQGFDYTAGLEEARDTRRVANLSFASVVYPRRRFSLALYRHELARFRASATSSGIFLNPPPDETRFFPSRSSLDLRVVSYGASVALKVNDSLNVGLSVARQRMRLDSRTERYLWRDLHEPPSYTEVVNIQEQHGDDIAYALNAGLLWAIDRRFNLGLVYRQGSSFDVGVSSGPAGATNVMTLASRFHVPRVIGAGLAYRPSTDGLTVISLDVSHIGYSVLTNGFVPLLGERNLYRVDDALEVRLGYERYVVPDAQRLVRSKYPVIVRGGAWREPDHRVRFGDPRDPQAVLFRPGEAHYHASAGFGVAFGANYELDVGYDYSRVQRVLSLSMAASF